MGDQPLNYLKRAGRAEKMTGGRFIAETLKGYGVTHIFYMEAVLRELNIQAERLGIYRVLGHSEKAVAYMADGYARAARRPGICLAQSVGAANLAAGLQDACLANSPVIAFTGKQPPAVQHRHAYQEIAHEPLYAPVTKYNVSIDTVKQLPFILRQAFREATSGCPGPVHLDVIDNFGRIIESAEAEMEVMVETRFAKYPPFRCEPEAELIAEATSLLAASQRPVIVAGGGAKASSAGPEIVELAEMMSIPVATSLSGKGTILENHPLSVGVVGAYSAWCANRVVSEADLVLFVGSRTGDQTTNGWKIPAIGSTVIQIDIEPTELGRSYPNAVGLAGDARLTVRRLVGALKGRAAKDDWAAHAKGIVKSYRDEIQALGNSDDTPIRVERLCRELTQILPADAVLVADTGYSGIWTAAMVNLLYPDQIYLRAAGSLGWAFPASLGAKCALPDRPVVCFTGDGGFWYHMAELETAARLGIRTVTVINNNNCLAQVNHNVIGVEHAYAGRPGNREEMYKYRGTHFAKFAKDMGCLGLRVERPRDIAGALETALADERPAVVEVVTDESCEAPWPWSPA